MKNRKIWSILVALFVWDSYGRDVVHPLMAFVYAWMILETVL